MRYFTVVIKHIVKSQIREVYQQGVYAADHFKAIEQVIKAYNITVPLSLFARLEK
jgi:hypothetical protein